MRFKAFKSISALTGEAWRHEMERSYKALMETPLEERTQALMDFCNGDREMFKALYGGIVTTKEQLQRRDFMSDLFSMDAERQPDMVDNVSKMLTGGWNGYRNR